MEGKQLIQRLTLRNFLSYGSEGAAIDLLPLNVLIGPNASGKSNLVEALVILRATATDLAAALREGGGIGEYIWKGDTERSAIFLEVWTAESVLVNQPLHYGLALKRVGHRPEVVMEFIEDGLVANLRGAPQGFYRFAEGRAFIQQRVSGEMVEREIRELAADQSILAQRRDPDLYPELTYLSIQFYRIAVFRDWTFGERTQVRVPQATDLPTDFLLPDARNLVLVLHDLMQRSKTEQRLIEYLRRFYQSAQRIRTKIQGGMIELYIDEGLDDLVPATRLSDGTLRYLSLLAILLHPSPPPLVCIEEPELGLHPDVLPTIAELLLEASQRTQLIVTTHSDALVSALSEVPESIVVCEPSVRGTQLRRLDRAALAEWLSQYSLGELWRIGGIGGTRW